MRSSSCIAAGTASCKVCNRCNGCGSCIVAGAASSNRYIMTHTSRHDLPCVLSSSVHTQPHHSAGSTSCRCSRVKPHSPPTRCPPLPVTHVTYVTHVTRVSQPETAGLRRPEIAEARHPARRLPSLQAHLQPTFRSLSNGPPPGNACVAHVGSLGWLPSNAFDGAIAAGSLSQLPSREHMCTALTQVCARFRCAPR